ncbi:MAG: hypothetical protein J6X60_00875 [Ruminiclostridium sp.]|nr:hypothetical protein [Ruminiclostridium sp.]
MLSAPFTKKLSIKNHLAKHGARSEPTAKTLSEIGIVRSQIFDWTADIMVSRGLIGRTADGRYYLLNYGTAVK